MGILPLRGDFRRIDVHDAEIFFRSDFLKSHLHRLENPGKFHRGQFRQFEASNNFMKKKVSLPVGPSVRPIWRVRHLVTIISWHT